MSIVERVPGGVMIRDPAVKDAAALITLGLRWATTKDPYIAPPLRLHALVHGLTRLASECGHENRQSQSVTESLTTNETAVRLGIHPRSVRRLAHLLDGRRTTAGWLIPTASVDAYQERTSAA